MNRKQTTPKHETAPKNMDTGCGSCAQKQKSDLWTVAELAESMQMRGLDIGRNRLHTWLREHGFTDRSHWKGQNLPTRKALDAGFMVIDYVESWNKGRDWMITRPSIRITPLGRAYFTGLFVQEGRGL